MLRLNASLCSKILFRQQKPLVCVQDLFKKENILRLKFSSQVDTKTNIKLEKIYHGVLTPQIRAVKIFSLSSSIGGIMAQPFLYQKAVALGGGPVIAVCGIIGFFTFVTPILLHLITKKYVTQIDYNDKDKSYTATTISFFLQKQKLNFTPEDVDIPDIPGMFTSLIIKGKPVFIELKQFTDAFHYSKIMGYDKPMDFKLNEYTPPEDAKK